MEHSATAILTQIAMVMTAMTQGKGEGCWSSRVSALEKVQRVELAPIAEHGSKATQPQRLILQALPEVQVHSLLRALRCQQHHKPTVVPAGRQTEQHDEDRPRTQQPMQKQMRLERSYRGSLSYSPRTMMARSRH